MVNVFKFSYSVYGFDITVDIFTHIYKFVFSHLYDITVNRKLSHSVI